jgi:hypothetical protein
MNATHFNATSTPRTTATESSRFTATPIRSPSKAAVEVAQSDRYRTRDFGIGYGSSSGYAADKRYTSDWGQPRFRCR